MCGVAALLSRVCLRRRFLICASVSQQGDVLHAAADRGVLLSGSSRCRHHPSHVDHQGPQNTGTPQHTHTRSFNLMLSLAPNPNINHHSWMDTPNPAIVDRVLTFKQWGPTTESSCRNLKLKLAKIAIQAQNYTHTHAEHILVYFWGPLLTTVTQNVNFSLMKLIFVFPLCYSVRMISGFSNKEENFRKMLNTP